MNFDTFYHILKNFFSRHPFWFIFIAFVMLFWTSYFVFASTLQDYYNTGDNDADGLSSTTWIMQTFTPSLAYIPTSAKFKMYKAGTPGTVTAQLWAVDGSHNPTGSSLCQGTQNGNDFTTDGSGAWYEFALSSCPEIQASTEYGLLLKSGASGAVWRFDNPTAGYPGGLYNRSLDSGSSWTTNATYDLMFEVYSADATTTPSVLDNSFLLALVSAGIFLILLLDLLRRHFIMN